MAVNFITSNAQRELVYSITASHMKYLLEDKYSSEIKYRRELEDYIREFINYEYHGNKFTFPCTSEILRGNVKCENFNALKAAEAWSALSTYAKNLYNQPWRPEFREIKLYSGFYKHQIESHLKGAEIMLDLMGYKSTGNRLVLNEPIDREILCQVSLDALKAMCECQVLFSIYEELTRHKSDVTYADILKYRETYQGSVDQIIRLILHRTSANFGVEYHSDPSLRTYYPNYKTNVRDYSQPCISTANGYVVNYRDEIPYQFSKGHCECVRTAKLIDLDDSYGQECRSTRSNRRAVIDSSMTGKHRLRLSDQLLSDSSDSIFDDKNVHKHETRKSDGSRDYIYKQSDKENAKNKPNYQLSSSQSRHHAKSNGVSEAFNNISLRPDVERNDKSGDSSVEGRKQSGKNQNFLEASKRVDRWSCTNCTFENAKWRDVCEMCSKSKNVTEEAPMESGGRECKRCTLVNKKEALKCEACSKNLENAPTYV